jgi:hypothetical protein
MGRLQHEDWFKGTQMTDLHRELLIKCFQHDYYWLNNLMDMAFAGRWQGKVLEPFFKLFAYIVKFKARQSGINLTVDEQT